MNQDMALAVKPARVRVEDALSQLTITIAWSRKLKQLLLGIAWVVVWVLWLLIILGVGFVFITQGVARDRSTFALLMLIPLVLGLFFWSLRGFFGIKAVLQQFIVKEVVQVSASGIQLTRQYLFFKLTREYPIDEIGVFCATKPKMTDLPFTKLPFTTLRLPSTAWIGFRYQNKRLVFFGMELEKEQADNIVRLIQSKFSRISRYRPELVN